MPSCLHVGCGHGRIETRAAAVSHDIGWLQDLHRWPDLETADRIEAVRKADGERTRTDNRCQVKIAISQNRTVLIHVQFALATRFKV